MTHYLNFHPSPASTSPFIPRVGFCWFAEYGQVRFRDLHLPICHDATSCSHVVECLDSSWPCLPLPCLLGLYERPMLGIGNDLLRSVPKERHTTPGSAARLLRTQKKMSAARSSSIVFVFPPGGVRRRRHQNDILPSG